MKHSFLLAILFIPWSSWAAPADHIGDYVKIRITYFGKSGVQEKEIIKYDASTDSYLVHAKGVDPIDGQPQDSEEWVSASALKLATKDQGAKTVSECSTKSGTLEKIQIGSEVYEVCRIYFYKDTSYQLFGPFPFDGIAGFVSKDDTDMAGTVLDFRWGKLK